MKCREGRLAKEKVVSLADGIQMQSVKGEAELEKQHNDSLGHKNRALEYFLYSKNQADGRQAKNTSRRGKTVFGVSIRGLS